MSITGVAVQTRRTECGVVLGMDLCLYTSWRLGAFFVGAVEVREAYSASLTECLKVFNNTPPSVLKENLILQGFSKKSLQVFSESIFNSFLESVLQCVLQFFNITPPSELCKSDLTLRASSNTK